MRYNTQLILHDPDRGLYGDCFRTCLSCILDLVPSEVPHYMGESLPEKVIWNKYNRWLMDNHNLQLFSIAYSSLEDVFSTMRILNPGIIYLLMGQGERGFNHQVLAMGNKIIHDPHPFGSRRLIGPDTDHGYYWVDILISNKHVVKGEEQ